MSHVKIPSPVTGGIRFINETESIITGTGDYGIKRLGGGFGETSDTSDNENENGKREHSLSGGPKPGKKTRGRVKIEMRFIENKLRRYTTFSKRKTGIMKKAFELSTLTGTQVMLLVASETGHVYTFATRKLQPMITSESGKALIQTCLNSPDGPGSLSAASPGDVRMNPGGFEEPELSYAVDEESDSSQSNVPKPLNIASSASTTGSSLFLNHAPSPVPAERENVKPPQLTQIPTSFPSEPMQLTTTSTGNAPQKGSSPNAAVKTNVAVQLPQGVATLFPQTGYPQGTPFAVAAPGASNQALYRIQGPGGQGQMVTIPGIAASPAPAPAHQPTTSINNNNKPKDNINTASSQVPAPLAIVPATTNPGYVYQMPQGLMYATGSGIPEGYMLSVPQTPTLALSQEAQAGTPTQQYIFQVPVSPATGQPQFLQPILAPQATPVAKTEKK